DLNLLLNSSWPQFTSCFQSSYLVFVPNGLLWCSMLFYIPWVLSRPPGPPLPHTPANVAKTVLSLMLSLCTIVAVLTEAGFDKNEAPYPTAHYVARFVEGRNLRELLLRDLLAAGLTQLERCRGVINLCAVRLWLILAVVDVIPLYHYIILGMVVTDVGRLVIFFVSYTLILAQLGLQAVCADLPRNYVPGACPETTATFLSRVTFSWMTSRWNRATFWRLNPRDESATVVPRFENALERSKARNRGMLSCRNDHVMKETREEYVSFSSPNNNHNDDSNEDTTESVPLLSSGNYVTYSGTEKKKRALRKRRDVRTRDQPSFSLMHVMIRTYCGDVLLSYVCKLCSDVLQYLGPVLLSLLITYTQATEDREWKGYVIAVGMLVVSWSQTVFYHQHYHVAMTTGMRMKTALMAAIYKKALRLSTEGQQAGTVGEVVNMMAVDCQRVQDMMSYTWMVWSIPLQVMLAVYLLWDTLGVSVLAGVGLLVLLVPVNGYLAFRQQKLQKANLHWKDKRIKIMNEIISGIKVLKLYAWETSFQDKVLAIRKREIGILTKVAHLNAFSIFIWTCAPYLVTLATFATYVLSDPDARLDANKAFVTLSLFNILQFPIAFVPEAISFTAQASVSIKRIDKFLKLAELDQSVVSRTAVTDFAVLVERGLFAWDVKGRSTLHGINLEVSEGELVAVVGGVGSGKSSLLAAILGEIDCRQGKVVLKQAWIQNETLRNNILFGKELDSKRYRKVLGACALTPDLAILPGEDQTEIGEKGINLSGGQKQRVSLARAVYADADIYLLDDPLSAVDSHVGKHIFRKVISDKGMLKRKTRILVTHAVHWLPLVDTVVLMQDGRIVEVGSYMQLMRRNGALAQYLHNVLSTSEDTDNEDDPEVLELKRRIMEHVESVTSTSEGGTSGDEIVFRKDNGFLASHDSPPGSSLATPDVCNAPTASPLAAHLTMEEQVKLNVFGSYARHVGFLASAAILFLFAGYQVSSIYASFWLTDWTGDATLTASNSTTAEVRERNGFYLTYYGILGAMQAVFISLYAFLAAVRMTKAAANMHASMLDRVVPITNELLRHNAVRSYCQQVRARRGDDRQHPASDRLHVRHGVSSPSSALSSLSPSPTPLFMSIIPSSCHRVLCSAANRWLGVWIEVVSSLVVFAATIFALVTPDITGSQTGLSVTYALQ
ncbi:hypothetical protein BaRGS_00022610, partial [Batillaria attramentaria]